MTKRVRPYLSPTPDFAVSVYTEFQYKMTYTGDGNYLQLLNVHVSVSLSDGFQVNDLYINSGQKGILSKTQTEEVNLRTTNYSFTPSNWGMVRDDLSGNFCTLGTYVRATFSRGDATVYVLTITNQRYMKSCELNGEIYWQESADPLGVMIDALQRSERYPAQSTR